MAAGVVIVTEPKDQSARIAGDVLKMARMVVAAEGGSVTKVLSDICRPVLRKRLQSLIDGGLMLPPEEPSNSTPRPPKRAKEG